MSVDKKVERACIIDDDMIFVFGFKKLVSIKNLCSQLIDFANGKEALDFFTDPANAENLPDVIFLDINMPIMDGWGFIEKFGEIKPKLGKNITVYMVSSSINHLDISRAKNNAQILDYAVKPLTTDRLIEMFNRASAA